MVKLAKIAKKKKRVSNFGSFWVGSNVNIEMGIPIQSLQKKLWEIVKLLLLIS